MDWCRKVTPKMLLEAFPNFTQLKALKLDGTKCTDRVRYVNFLLEKYYTFAKVVEKTSTIIDGVVDESAS